MTIEFIALTRLKFGTDYIMPGERVPVEEYPNRRYDRMLSMNQIKIAEEEDVTEASAPEEDLYQMTNAELSERLDELGISTDSIEGSGANGNVVKDDLVRALQDAR